MGSRNSRRRIKTVSAKWKKLNWSCLVQRIILMKFFFHTWQFACDCGLAGTWLPNLATFVTITQTRHLSDGNSIVLTVYEHFSPTYFATSEWWVVNINNACCWFVLQAKKHEHIHYFIDQYFNVNIHGRRRTINMRSTRLFMLYKFQLINKNKINTSQRQHVVLKVVCPG